MPFVLNASTASEIEESMLESPAAARVHRRLRPAAKWARRRQLRTCDPGNRVGWLACSHRPTYATAIGEQRTLRLADGSLLQLNTHSRVQVHLTSTSRDVRLLEGEAFFSVQHDPSRPFRVESGGTLVQAVGTQFNVYRGSSGQTRGGGHRRSRSNRRARSRTRPGSAAAVTCGRTDQHCARDALIKQKDEDVANAVAWRQRKLVFNGKRLEDVAAEFNRYNQRRIVIKGDAAA